MVHAVVAEVAVVDLAVAHLPAEQTARLAVPVGSAVLVADAAVLAEGQTAWLADAAVLVEGQTVWLADAVALAVLVEVVGWVAWGTTRDSRTFLFTT